MTDIATDLIHARVFGDPPIAPAEVDEFNHHGFPAGLAADGYMVLYRPLAPRRWVLSNNAGAFINGPMRVVLLASSAEIASFTTATKFNKSLPLDPGLLNGAGTVVRVRAGGRLSTHSTPGAWHFSVWLNDSPSGQCLGGSAPIPLTASVVDLSWSIDVVGTTRTTGASGIVFPGVIDVALPGPDPPQLVRLGTVGQNLTAATTIDFYVAGSVSHASNKTTLEWAFADVAYGGTGVG